MLTSRSVRFSLVALCCLLVGADQPEPSLKSDKAALATCNGLIGSWKGVAQPVRGSAKGAWNMGMDIRWNFKDNHANLFFEYRDGYFETAELRPGKKTDEFELIATRIEGKVTIAEKDKKVKFNGTRTADGKLILTNESVVEFLPERMTLQVVAAGDRMTILYEKSTGEGKFARLSEVGFTREGSGFGKGGGGPECIVTGGAGTISVDYKGQTYYVCCGGCRDAFKDSPEQILAEYKERIANRQKGEGK